MRWPEIHADYDNQPDGLHQAIVLERRPPGSGRLAVALDITGAQLDAGSDFVVLEYVGGTLRLDAIAARDARGRALPVALAVEAGRLVLAIDDRHASYPVTVKTLLNGTADALLDSDQAGAQLGFSVAGAGDVNGDGFADVIVGVPAYDNGEMNEGAAFVFFGGPGAFNLLPDARLESNQVDAQLGASVAGAGDVNGDGYADVIVGAELYDNGESDEGAAFVYFGGAGTFNSTPDAQLESNQVIAFLGTSVAGAGDVNGDGFADVIVGARLYDNIELNEGAAFVYFGGAGAFNPTPDAQLESNQANAFLGARVAGVGDVNGDGFADVIVGANGYDNGEANEGVAFVYHGTARGRLVVAGQYRGGGASPVQAGGLSHQADGFVVALEATSPRGRERARLQLEACPPAAPFGSLLCNRYTATAWTELADPSGTTLALTATGLNLNGVYHWRARVQYAALSVTAPGIVSPPNPPTGPWRRAQANADVADIRTSVPLTPGIFSNGFE